MKNIEMKYQQYLGILLGASYGYVYRLLCGRSDARDLFDVYDLYSLTFMWVLPIVIGIIPILFARKEILESEVKQFVFPFLSVLLFFVMALTSELEDLICILIFTFPFMLAAGVVGVIVAPIIKRRQSKKLYSIVLLPLILGPIESMFPGEIEHKKVLTSIVIESERDVVWGNLIEVPEIKEDEFEKGFFNYIGVPRPIRSELKTINGTEYRIGYFTDELELYETISEMRKGEFVEFQIHINESKLRDVPTDNHLLKSDHFTFDNISYELKEIAPGRTELILSCDYTLNSRMNGYANFWAEKIVKDFETRLLNALKLKIENGSR